MKNKDLRSKFKATKIEDLEKIDQAEEQRKMESMGVGSSNSIKKIEFKDVDEKLLRILPGHDGNPYYEQVTLHWLPYEKEEEKDGEKTIKKTVYPYKNAIVHCGAQKDIVQEYIKLAVKELKENGLSGKELKDALDPINGYRDKAGKFHGGISDQSKYCMYVNDLNSNDTECIYEFEANYTIKKGINQTAKDNPVDGGNGAMGSDPFTDVEDGLPINVKVNKKVSNPADKYKVSVKLNQKPYPLSDQVLSDLLDTKSLVERYRFEYTRKDLERALTGLELFEEANDYNVFEMPEWEDTLEWFLNKYPEQENSESNKESEEQEDGIEEEDEEVDFDKEGQLNDLDGMTREELEDLIDEKELNISYNRRTSDDDLREMIRKEGGDLPWDTKEEEKKSEPEEPVRRSRRRSKAKA